MSRVLVTGATGFVGRALCAHLAAAGHYLIAASRGGASVNGVKESIVAVLTEPLVLPAGSTIDVVVHAANDASPDAFLRNVEGTLRWVDDARNAGATLQILLSSLSADAQAESDYGRAKHALEQRFLESYDVALRLGVVVGNGGMFARLVKSTRGPVIPLLDGGVARVSILGIDFLCRAIATIIAADGDGFRGEVLHIQQPDSFSLREVLTAICSAESRRPRFVTVPTAPVLGVLTLLERCRIKLPISATNIQGLRQSAGATFPSNFNRFGESPAPLDELVSRARRMRTDAP